LGQVGLTCLVLAGLLGPVFGEDKMSDQQAARQQAKKAFDQGNFKDAYDAYRRLALDPKDDPKQVSGDLHQATLCLATLDRVDELDALLEEAVQVHKENWRLLEKASQIYTDFNFPQDGFVIAGKFQRGNHRGNDGKYVNVFERDRVRALQLMVQAWPLAQKDADHAAVSDFLLEMARMFMLSRSDNQAWKLQTLTDLGTLPDYEESGRGRYGNRESAGAPVDADGKPVVYAVPKSFETAENDGQRWRWCLQQAAEVDSQKINEVRWELAQFALSQFGVQTMADSGWSFGREEVDDTKHNESGIYDLHTLSDDETIAKLATGIQRFRMPEDYNYIKLFQQIVFSRQIQSVAAAVPHEKESQEALARIFENRRQYLKAADYWRQLLKEYPTVDKQERENWQHSLDQIIGNWGSFDSIQDQPAGQGATVEYRFRNGKQVEFTAHAIKVEKLLADVKAYLKSSPKQLDGEQLDIANIGYRIIQKDQSQYLGEQVAQWKMDLKPRENHFDSRVTVTTSLKKAGAYLLTAKMADGNTCFIVVWVADTAIVKKPLNGKTLYYVADAVSGKPIAKANVEFFGWRQFQYQNPNRVEIHTKQFAENTDDVGQVVLDESQLLKEHQWLAMARTDDGRLAYLGFSQAWYNRRHDIEYDATKAYCITDRPVYRPAQSVKYKFWIRQAKYDLDDVSRYADQAFTIEIHNPKGEKIATEMKWTDAFGGMEGEYALPADAALGMYQVQVRRGNRGFGGGNFRVEEYKKPEFEVTVDAPTEPVMLGEKITATIKAKYYFGSPVTNAKVKYKVTRTTHSERWYPVGPWDWFYGTGYWWFGYDYDWYPGWKSWGCFRPTPFWWPHSYDPPEVVAEQEVAIGADGTVKVEFDTAAAKAIHPDQDHSYQISAEVVDASRRTIVGQGTVLVARKPFAVYAWLDRGYYRTGDTVTAHFSARTLDGKPVQGQGKLTLLKITYATEKDPSGNVNLKPIETPVQTWDINTNDQGMADQQLTASESGQYRLSYQLTDTKHPSSANKAGGEDAGDKKLPSPVGGRGAGGEGGPQPVSAETNPSAPSSQTASNAPMEEETKPHTIEGGYLFTIVGEGFDGSQFRFNHLELIPEKREYAPGEKVKLQINTDRTGGTVLLFLRPSNGVYLPPKMIHLDGKSIVEEFDVVQKDMPNFFVEALTVADGRVYTECKEIVVPPEKRVLNVEIQPTKEAYKPGEKAKVQIKLTDLQGKPFVGSTVVAIYDKSLEYISGGSNIPEIKEFFWKWRRQHHPLTEDNLERWSNAISKPNAVEMRELGVFGGEVPTESAGVAGFGGMGEVPGRGGRNGTVMSEAMPCKAMAPAPMQAGGMDRTVTFGMSAPAACDLDGEGAYEPSPNGSGGIMVEPTVRTKFADTALWVGSLTTEKDGTAEVSLDMPENLTTWRIKTWAMGQGTRVGQGQTDVVTRKDLIIRLEAPRFFVQTDEVVLSAVVHNYLKTKKKVQVQLEFGENSPLVEILPGATVPIYSLQKPVDRTVEVEPNSEARVDWRVKVLSEGEAVVRMKALTDEESDAMEQTFPCYIHGMLKTEAFSGVVRPKEESGKFTINVPADRQPAQSRLEVRWSPTLAGAMVDALPYMVDYPYGCTEQTLNRFLPTVITQKILLDMKLDLKDIEQKRTNLNAQEIGNDADRAKQWAATNANRPRTNPLSQASDGTVRRNPVFDQAEVIRMVKDGVQRLTEMQCSDGGWGWFSGYGEHSSPHTTAVVVHGLQIAKQNDVALVPGILERGVEWLKRYQDEQVQLLKNGLVKDKPNGMRWKDAADNIDALVYMVLADADVKNVDMCEFLYRDRSKISVYGMAMFGLALHKQAEKEKLDMILQNIGQYVEQDNENQTAWLRLPHDGWWCWYGSENEAHAYYLKLLAQTDPKGELASRLVKYLLNNRKNATYWNSTRDTALCIEAMADFIRQSGEDRPNMTVEVYYDGKLQKAVEITPQNLFGFDNKFVLEGVAIENGQHQVELKKKGTGPLYFNGYLTNFTTEDFITKAGLDIKVNRKYYKLNRVDKTVQAVGSRGQAVDQKVEKYERQELPNLAEVKSGDLVEIELEIDSKNDYEYLIFEDMKPAGFEPVDLRSGYIGNDLGAYVEFRDNCVVFFARTLARGKHSVAYRMRAEIPGRFSALPTRGAAMYAPELKANSDEMKIGVTE
jgi:uncharacterized protein YfaS (alpha-2-macroglobulin family)